MEHQGFKNFITEVNYSALVCSCNEITRGQLLQAAKFNQTSSKEDIMKSLMTGGCGCCLKSKKDFKSGGCSKRNLDVHYTDVIK